MDYRKRTQAGLEAAVRNVLSQLQSSPATSTRPAGPLGNVRRKHLIQQIRMQAERYGLEEELAAFVYQAGCEALTGLDLAELRALDEWLADLGQCVETACDSPYAPPAR